MFKTALLDLRVTSKTTFVQPRRRSRMQVTDCFGWYPYIIAHPKNSYDQILINICEQTSWVDHREKWTITFISYNDQIVNIYKTWMSEDASARGTNEHFSVNNWGIDKKSNIINIIPDLIGYWSAEQITSKSYWPDQETLPT